VEFNPHAALAKHCVASENTTNQGVSAPASADVALRVAQNAVDPDLARVVEAWPDLPEAIRRAVLALVGSANG
jgi:hypothetical protein